MAASAGRAFTIVAAALLVRLCSCGDAMKPMAPCAEGRVTYYTGWETGGACSFGPWDGATGYGYKYSAAPNEAFYDKGAQCGICYELVGPLGATRIIVADMCPVKGNTPCDGSMTHFDLSDPTFPLLADPHLGVVNVTFRMISCDVTGNLKVRINSDSSVYWFSVLVFNHRVGLSAVDISKDNGTTWLSAPRQDYNEWVYSPPSGSPLTASVLIRVTSITNEKITLKAQSITGYHIYEADSQFSPIPAGYGGSSDSCCSPPDHFTNVYDNALRSGWTDSSWSADTDYSSGTSPHSGSDCLRVTFDQYGGLQIFNSVGADAVQYSSFDFWVRGGAATEPVLVWLTGDGKTGTKVYTPSITTSWQHVSLNFTALAAPSSLHALCVQSNVAATLYFDDIQFVKAANAPTTKDCANGVEVSNNSKADDSQVDDSTNNCHNTNCDAATFAIVGTTLVWCWALALLVC
eukprot:TRINITY_DN7648_c0_g1_i1.p1 TRINITY_DN7648_c0_g1~~TRINITY_DN7648_c0_g1_i1.p1  ORF type:complete len:462 (+),score=108.05 TRINITY_DN7648_c0_g1_i1:16-1401(+)